MYVVETIKNINYGATGVEEILQNVAFIMSTVTMSCPLDREFGHQSVIDKPINVAKAMTSSRIIEAINKFEPRATVEVIEFTGDAQRGLLQPRLKVTINDQSI